MPKLFKGILIFTIIAIVAIAVAGIIKFNIIGDDIYITQKDGSVVLAADLDEYAITAEDGTTGVFAYTSKDKNTATLDIDGNFYQLARVESASGTRYANEDESVIYWEHQGEATIEINGEIAHTITDIVAVDILVPAPTDEAVETSPAVDNDCSGPDADTEACTLGDQVSDIGITVAQQGVAAPVVPIETTPTLSEDPLMTNDWAWKETVYNNDTVVTPTDSSSFIARFTKDGTFSSTTDCNNTFGAYTRDKSALTFGPLAATMMACMESQEMEYGKMLGEVTSYMIADNGNLVLMLKYDSGSMIFTPHVSSETDTTTTE